jgi:hypothetical protein
MMLRGSYFINCYKLINLTKNKTDIPHTTKGRNTEVHNTSLWQLRPLIEKQSIDVLKKQTIKLIVSCRMGVHSLWERKLKRKYSAVNNCIIDKTGVAVIQNGSLFRCDIRFVHTYSEVNCCDTSHSCQLFLSL